MLEQLRTFPAGRGRRASDIAAGMDDLGTRQVSAALRRLVKSGQARDEDGLYSGVTDSL